MVVEIRNVFLLAVSLAVFGFITPDAFAYIDPGTGSLAIQAIVGVLVGAGITIKIYWHQFKEKILSIKR